MKKHALAQEAIRAAVDAIEKNGYKLVVPIEFDVTHVPVEKTGSNVTSLSDGHESSGGGKQKKVK